MVVELARGALGRARRYPSFVVVQVKDASDPDAVLAALDGLHPAFCAYFDTIWAAEGGNPDEVPTPNGASDGIPAPGGPMLWSDCAALPDKHLRTWLDFVVRHLEDHGVDHAVVDVVKSEVEVPEDTAWAFEQGRNVFLWATTKPWDGRLSRALIPEADRFGTSLSKSVPPAWRQALVDFIADATDDDGNVLLGVAGVNIRISPEQISGLVAARERIVDRRQNNVENISAGYFTFLDPAYATVAAPPTIKIARAGDGIKLAVCALADTDTEILASAMVDLRDRGRRLDPLPHAAFVASGHRFGAARGSGPGYPVDRPGGAQIHLATFEDTLFDAYWYQIISRAHVDRLGAHPQPPFPSTTSIGRSPSAGPKTGSTHKPPPRFAPKPAGFSPPASSPKTKPSTAASTTFPVPKPSRNGRPTRTGRRNQYDHTRKPPPVTPRRRSTTPPGRYSAVYFVTGRNPSKPPKGVQRRLRQAQADAEQRQRLLPVPPPLLTPVPAPAPVPAEPPVFVA